MSSNSAERQPARARTVFITGTDTNVGKTVLTALLLAHLRRRGMRALAIKPCCSGGRGDVELLGALQDHELEPDEMNPYFFSEPVAPLVAARKQRQKILLPDIVELVRRVARQCECLLIEGAGGLVAPLAEDGTALDLIRALNCETVVVTPNRLGVINHTVLTMLALQGVAGYARIGGRSNPTISPGAGASKAGVPGHSMTRGAGPDISRKPLTLVMMEQRKADASARDNPRILREMLPKVPIRRLPFFGQEIDHAERLKVLEKKFQKSLAWILG